MELLLVFLPLAGSLFLLGGGRWLGTFWGPRLATALVAAALLLAGRLFALVGLGHAAYRVDLFPWMEVSLLRVGWSFHYDGLTVAMLLVVLSVSLFVHLYSLEYMGEDPHLCRFFGYLSLFTFFMELLVTAGNLLHLFVGWEGVGVCSYLLIGFWFTRRQAAKAALKAMVVNRVGDFGLLVAMALLYRSVGSLDFAVLFPLAPSLAGYVVPLAGWSVDLLTAVSLLLLFGAVGKSAQLGLHTWLPDAMEGPTPVSALIHAATMVTAGVFLLLRCSPLLEQAPVALAVVAVVGAVTALFGATVGLFQNDLKRVIAYSTCSQLGYMTFACGLSAYPAALFHLSNHAFFKAALFLGAGAVIHAYGDEQDMRRMGGLARLLPFTAAVMGIGSLSLMGFPFLTGFYSKDLLLEVAAATPTPSALFAYWLGSLVAALTAFYSIRLLYLTFWSDPRGGSAVYGSVGGHEPGWAMGLPLLALALASIFGGYLSRDLFVGLGTDFWGGALVSLPTHSPFPQAEFLPLRWKLLPVFCSLGGGLISLFLHHFLFRLVVAFQLAAVNRPLLAFFGGRWFFDLLQNRLVALPLLHFGYAVSFRLLDRGVVERFGPTGLATLLQRLVEGYRSLQSGYFYHYLFLMVLALVAFLALLAVAPFPPTLRLWVLLFPLPLFAALGGVGEEGGEDSPPS